MNRDSEVVILLRHVWENTPRPPWARLNHAMQAAMRLAVEAGFDFTPADLSPETLGKFRYGRWWGEKGWDDLYRLAVECGNLSAALAIESALGRPPYIADDVTLPLNGGTRARSRLAVRFKFPWKGRQVSVTSITPEYLIACEYPEYSRYSGYEWTCDRKVLLRHKITPADIKADRAARKEK